MRERKSGHIINVSSIGAQTNTPRFSAYVASKSALDAFSRSIASEIVDDRCHITTIYMPLVRTPMIAPTGIYDAFPTASPEEAADLISQAMIYRPKKVATRLGTFGEVLYALAPKSVDVILNTAFKLFPESAAAKGEKKKDARGRPPRRRVRAPDAGSALVGRDPQLAATQAQPLGLGVRGRAALAEELRAAAEGIRAHLGFGDGRRRGARSRSTERRASARRGSSRPPRWREICSTDAYERAAHAYGKAYRDVVRAFRGRFDHVPDVVAFAARRARRRASCWSGAASGARRRSRTAAARASSAASRPRVGDGYAGAVTIDLRGGSTGCWRSTARLARRAIQAGATGPGLEDQLREHDLTLRHFPQSFELSTLGGWIATRAGGHFATLYTHIDDLVESVTAVTPAGRSRGGGCPGRAPGRVPDRMLLGSEGILGVITEAWVRVQERPVHKSSAGVTYADFSGGRRGGAGAVAERPASVQLPAARPARGGAHRRRPRQSGRRRCSCLGFESADHPVDAGWTARSSWRATTAETVSTATASDGKDSVGRMARGVPARAVPARHVRRLRRDQRHVRDRDHLGPLPRVPRRGDGGGRAGGPRRLRRRAA